MGKLLVAIACIGFVTLLLSSTSLGDEQNQSVEKTFARELREAGDRPSQGPKNKRKKGSKGSKGKRNNGKKGARKSGNKKKARKSQKSNGKKGRKNNNKRVKKNGKPGTRTGQKGSGCTRQTTSTFCPTEKATSLKLLYNQVSNFKKQLKRAENHAKIVKKKKAKKDAFQKDAAILTDVVGGDLTAPSCLATARSASGAASQGSTLSSCSSTIASSCEEITINSTLTGSCSDTMTTFEAKVTECKGKASDSEECTCWTEAVAMKSDISKCKASDEADAVKTKKKTCLKTFGECKKAQDAAVEYTSTCPSPSMTTKSTIMTTKASGRRSLAERFLARNMMKREHNIVSA